MKGINLFRFIYYNYFSRHVVRKGKGRLLPYYGAAVNLNGTGRVILGDGDLLVNCYREKGSRLQTVLRVDDGGTLEIAGSTFLMSGSFLRVFKGAKIKMGEAWVNSGTTIMAAKEITMDNGVLIARNVMIYDSDHHQILDENGNEANPSKPVHIGKHVWIGLGSTILRGSRIGDGAVIAANSLVGGKIKAGTLAQGNPARSYWPVTWDEKRST